MAPNAGKDVEQGEFAYGSTKQCDYIGKLAVAYEARHLSVL